MKTHVKAKPAARQRGVTLIEVMVALLVSLISASAMVLLASHVFTANAQSRRAYAATLSSRSLLSTIEGNPQILGSLNGVALGAASGSTPPDPLQDWWTAAQQKTYPDYPDVLGVSLTTSPSTCSPSQPCRITATIQVRSAFFGGGQSRTFVLQDGF
jgi:prepilin-type N-terminal cleavage/methylation domain-containing protein